MQVLLTLLPNWMAFQSAGAEDDAYGHDLAELMSDLIVGLAGIPTLLHHLRPRPKTSRCGSLVGCYGYFRGNSSCRRRYLNVRFMQVTQFKSII